jgi:hypothetical protein
MRLPPPRSVSNRRLVDRALGVSRRRRRLAYVTIAGGYQLLRPAVHRVAAVAGVCTAALVTLVVF